MFIFSILMCQKIKSSSWLQSSETQICYNVCVEFVKQIQTSVSVFATQTHLIIQTQTTTQTHSVLLRLLGPLFLYRTGRSLTSWISYSEQRGRKPHWIHKTPETQTETDHYMSITWCIKIGIKNEWCLRNTLCY